MNLFAIILMVLGGFGGVMALGLAIACKSDPKIFKISRICTLICVVMLIIGIIIPSVENSNKQKKFEEAVILEIEQKIEEFTQGNPADNVKYEITIGQIKKYRSDVDVRVVYKIETTREPEVVAGKKFYPFYDYDILFSPCKIESVDMSADLYGEVYVNGELRKTEKNITSSSGDSKTCQICGTSYSDSENVKNIQRSNMCTRCYKNYKYAADAAGY